MRLVLPASDDLGGAHDLMWDPAMPGDYLWVNIAGTIGLFVLSFVLWRISQARELQRTL